MAPTELTEKKFAALLAGRPFRLTPAKGINSAAGYDPVIGPDEPRPAFRVLIREAREGESFFLGGRNGPLTIRNLKAGAILAHITGISTSRTIVSAQLPDGRYTVIVNPPVGAWYLTEKLVTDALESMFGIQLHREKRVMDVLVLKAQERARDGLKPGSGGGSSRKTLLGEISVTGGGASTDFLAEQIEATLGVPTINETGITGRFLWQIRFDRDHTRTLLQRVRDEMGLIIEETRREIEVLVVEPKP